MFSLFQETEIAKSALIVTITTIQVGYPVYTIRRFGISRKELPAVMAVGVVGKYEDIHRDLILPRWKEDVENTVQGTQEVEGAEHIADYKDQLNRWLEDYPDVRIVNEVPPAGKDLNEDVFPLPKVILMDPLLLRMWIQEWQLFDTEVPEEGAWTMLELLNIDYGDAHETFAEIVKKRIDESLPEFDFTIDGEAAWAVIEIEIFKNDTTTEKQEVIWKLREKRTNLNDEKWMENRRLQIAESFFKRHENRLTRDRVMQFLSFCENLKISWQKFLALLGDQTTNDDTKTDDDTKTVKTGTDKTGDGEKEADENNQKKEGSENGDTNVDVTLQITTVNITTETKETKLITDSKDDDDDDQTPDKQGDDQTGGTQEENKESVDLQINTVTDNTTTEIETEVKKKKRKKRRRSGGSHSSSSSSSSSSDSN